MTLDLNLLSALDALLEEGSVAGAANRLHLSQPAMSRTLGRIRRSTGDQILVRTGRTMIPTPYALAIRKDVHVLVQQAEAVLAPDRTLDLATLERTFSLQFHDAVTSAIGPQLLAAVRTQTPRVALRFLAETSVDTSDLRHGRVDIAIGSEEPVSPEIRFERIGHDRLVLAVRPEHPLVGGRITVERFAQAEHITVSRRGRLRDPVDDELAKRHLQRRVVASAPTVMTALGFVRESDVVVAVAERLCQPMVSALRLQTVPIPLGLPPISVVVSWHQRYELDSAHAWLRNEVREALETAVSRDT